MLRPVGQIVSDGAWCDPTCSEHTGSTSNVPYLNVLLHAHFTIFYCSLVTYGFSFVTFFDRRLVRLSPTPNVTDIFEAFQRRRSVELKHGRTLPALAAVWLPGFWY